MVALAIHTKKTHGKCSCYLETTNKSAQCDDCHFKYPRRTNLGGHLDLRHEVFEEITIETELETKKEETNNDANARKMRKFKLCNLCGKVFRNFAHLRYHVRIIHKQKAVGSTGLNEINNLELGLQVFKCQNCGKMCTIKRHLKLHEVKNMDGNFNLNKLCEKLCV